MLDKHGVPINCAAHPKAIAEPPVAYAKHILEMCDAATKEYILKHDAKVQWNLMRDVIRRVDRIFDHFERVHKDEFEKNKSKNLLCQMFRAFATTNGLDKDKVVKPPENKHDKEDKVVKPPENKHDKEEIEEIEEMDDNDDDDE